MAAAAATLAGRYVDLGLGEALFKAFVAHPEPGGAGAFAVKYVQGTKEIIQFHDNHTATSLSLPNVKFTWKLHVPHSDYFLPKLSQQQQQLQHKEDTDEEEADGEDRKKTPTKRPARKRTTPPPTATSERPRRSVTKRSRPTPRDDDEDDEEEAAEADPK